MQLIPALPYAHQSDINLVTAIYAMHLTQGHRIQCRTITFGTIKWYLMTAAAILEAHKLPDPRLNSRGTTSPYIIKVLDELRRWEAMPNLRELVTVVMLQRMHALCATQNEDSQDSALCGWNILGIYYGFRLGDWT